MFAFRLCLALGEIHPDYLLPRLTSRQLVEWQVVFEKLPFGQDLTDFHLARLTAMLMNRWRSKGANNVTVQELLPNFHQQSPEEMKLALRRAIG